MRIQDLCEEIALSCDYSPAAFISKELVIKIRQEASSLADEIPWLNAAGQEMTDLD